MPKPTTPPEGGSTTTPPEGGIPQPASGGTEGPAAPSFEPVTSQEQFDRMVKDRIARERSRYADYDELKTKAQRLADLEEADKTELQKMTEARDGATKERDQARGELLRFQIAFEKDLTQAQAKRLVGTTREELEADADELLEAFGSKGEGLQRPSTKPRSGSVPGAEPEENDPIKLAALVPRN